jgi:hypothetical protein
VPAGSLFALNGLRRSIEIEIPNPLSREELIELSRRFSTIDEELNKKCVDGLSFDWSGLQKK